MSKIRQAGAQSQPSASTQRSHPHDYGQGKQGVQYENTYKLEPDDSFPSAPIRKIINEILQVSDASHTCYHGSLTKVLLVYFTASSDWFDEL